MKVAVTGGSGFIGSALGPALSERGHAVRLLDRADYGDLGGQPDWDRLVGDAEAVVHLAAQAHARAKRGDGLWAVNVQAPIALGRVLAASGRRLVFLSTVKVHGEETPVGRFRESSPYAPRDAYGEAKAAAEKALRAIPGLRWTILRPPLVYGPGVKANFLWLARAVARGVPLPFAGIRNSRSLLYLGNLCDVIDRCLAQTASEGKAYLLSDGEAVSTPALCHALGEALGMPARLFSAPRALLELLPGGRKLTRSLEVDDAAVRRDLGWAPGYQLGDGLRNTARWLRHPGTTSGRG